MAIVSATYRSSNQISGTQYSVDVRLVTDDARGTFDTGFVVSGTTQVELRDAVSKEIARLNTEFGVRNVLAGIAVGTNIPITFTAPADSPAVAAFKVWQAKVRRLVTLTDIGTIPNGAMATAITNLRADINTTFVAGYEAQL